MHSVVFMRQVLCVVGVIVAGLSAMVLARNHKTQFCSQTNQTLYCDFKNTSEGVNLTTLWDGVKEINVTAATSLHGVQPCGTTLTISSCNNVTLQEKATGHTRNIINGPRQGKAFSVGEADDRSDPHRKSASQVTASLPHTDKLLGRENVSRGVSVEDKTEQCSRSLSVVQSKLKWLSGEFNVATLDLCEVDNVIGHFGTLSVRKSNISNFIVTGHEAFIEDTTMGIVSKLEVDKKLQLHRVKIERLASPGLVHHTASGGANGNGIPYNLSDVTVNLIENGSMNVLNGRVSVNHLRVNKMISEAITVGTDGVLTLKNIHVLRGPQTCLVLRGTARVLIYNFTLEDTTITNLDLASKSSLKVLYPLLSVMSNKDAVSDKFLGFTWYWVVIMTVSGVFAGLVIGTAIMWRKRVMSKCQPSILTLADLIPQDRQDDNEVHATDMLERPELSRQDSGLTSSSFASFTPMRQDPEICITSITEPNIYIHVPAHSCTQENIVYEEVENMAAHRLNSMYLASPSLTPRLDQPRLSTLGLRKQHDVDTCLSPYTEPKVYVHVPPDPCTNEEVIFEEAETLAAQKLDPIYNAMK